MTIKEDDSLPEYLHKDPGAPRWLFWSYILLPIWGLVVLYFFWNGSYGWLDRGSWQELQQAANTRYPYTNEQ